MTRAAIRLMLCGALVCLTAAVGGGADDNDVGNQEVPGHLGRWKPARGQIARRHTGTDRARGLPVHRGWEVAVGAGTEAWHAGHCDDYHEDHRDPRHRHRGEERNRHEGHGHEHHRRDGRRLQDVLAERHRQARCEDHARGPAGAEISDFRENDRMTATIITSKPPRVMTEKEVNASLAAPAASAPAAAAPAPAHGTEGTRAAASSAASSGDLGGCTEDAAQDGKRPAGSRARGPRVAPAPAWASRSAAYRDALGSLLVDAGPRPFS